MKEEKGHGFTPDSEQIDNLQPNEALEFTLIDNYLPPTISQPDITEVINTTDISVEAANESEVEQSTDETSTVTTETKTVSEETTQAQTENNAEYGSCAVVLLWQA